ncbi:MAG: double-strand break repair helicase AddA [Alphaproteobacteria bacterium]|nr:double-strand break repair helicase AddA [Alphaproteobacteria bacterium]
MTDPYRQAVTRQRAASDPSASVFVSANAGTGKTKVLTDRVLRLLLDGGRPEAILCVTYTRAAAAEMTQRLNRRLASWAVCPQSQLLEELAEMGESPASAEQIAVARNLFATILDNENGPRVETMHSFCQSVLARFPIEAGVPPHFQLASEAELTSLLVSCFYQLAGDPSAEIAELLAYLSSQADERSLLEHLQEIIANDEVSSRLGQDPAWLDGMEGFIRADLGWPESEALAAEQQAVLDYLAGADLSQLADQLSEDGKNGEKRAAQIRRWLALSEASRPAQLALLAGAFFTKGSLLKNLASKKLAATQPDLITRQQEIADHLARYYRAETACATAQRSLALARLAGHLTRRYQVAKWQRSWLDFDDLIRLADQLLARDGMMGWVQWKLDSGIQHLLVDEAQDTSPAQWRLLDRLAGPFFDSIPESDKPDRTLFAVGDFKQSIYRFQGASPAAFASQQEKFAALLQGSGRQLSIQNFTLSFRSSRAVLDFVDVMMSDPAHGGMGQDWQDHQTYWTGQPGFVECWPVTTAPPPAPPPAFLPPDGITDGGAAQLHAEKVAAHIKELLDNPDRHHIGRQIRPRDIMILLRKRDGFYAMLRGALARAGLPVAPADRVRMLNQIEILDLLALGDVCLFPEDDLQLAALLKSPLLGLDEDQLMALAIGRGKASLFSRLLRHRGADSAIGRACDRLLGWLDLAGQTEPFDFFARVLDAAGGRRQFSTRLGRAVDETLNSFLQMAADYSRSGQSGLGHFLRAFRDAKAEIKRELDESKEDQIRVMTMHGAKGLEAPIIYLPDMLRPRPVPRQLHFSETYLFWPPSSDFRPDWLETVIQAHKQEESEEEDRLLYVALTRARQGLVISGWQAANRRMEDNSWYEGLRARLEGVPEAEKLTDGRVQVTSAGLADGPSPPPLSSRAAALPVGLEKPDWLDRPPPPALTPPRPLRPSDSGPKERIRASQSGNSAAAARERGRLMHRLLELLGSLPAEARQAGLDSFWQRRRELAARLDRPAIEAELLNILEDPRLAPLFGPQALAEASLGGQVAGRIVAGQADRLVVEEKRVLLADFKTGQPPNATKPPEDYLRQMALYGALAEQIWPDKEIECWLIWTANSQIQEISQTERQAALAQLQAGLNGESQIE